MASEILGLFTSPDDYRAMQNQQTRNEALQYAQLTPFQRAEMSLYSGGRQLGGAGAQLFGMQDPQLRMISQRQALSQGIDPSDPESIMQAAQKAAELGDQQFALTLADYGRKAQSDLALVQQRTKEGRAAATPKELQIAGAKAELMDRIEQIKQLPDSPEKTRALGIAQNTLDSLQTVARQGQIPDAIEIAREQAALQGLLPNTPEYNKFVNDRIEKLTTKAERATVYGADRNAIAQGEFGKDFADLTQEEKKTVNTIADREKIKIAEAGATKPPVLGTGKLGAKEITDFRSSALKPVEPYINTVNATDSALTNLKLSIEKNNPSAFRGARVQLAKAFGDATLNREDVREAGGDPSLAGQILDTTSVLFTGTPSVATQRNIEATLKAMRKLAIKKGQDELNVQRRIATRAGFSQDDIADIFDIPAFRSKGGSEAGRTNETIPPAIESRITQVAPPTAAPKAATAIKPPAKGQKQTRTLKSGKTVTVETE
jgi:hypothetical protein